MPNNNKFAIILQAGAEGHEQHARAFHSLLYAKELREKQYDVRLVFDGAGTEWIAQWSRPDEQEGQDKALAGLFQSMKQQGLTYAICDFCSGAFNVKDKLPDGEPLEAQYMDHPSVATLVEDGYQVWIL